MQAVASLLNADGGAVFVGVTDAGDPVGLELFDFKQADTTTIDKFEAKLRNTLKTRLDLSPLSPSIEIVTEPVSGVTLTRIEVKPWGGDTPVYVDKSILVVRDGNQKHTLVGKDAAQWIAARTKRAAEI